MSGAEPRAGSSQVISTATATDDSDAPPPATTTRSNSPT
jgi:hypothetical protein